MFAMDTVHHVNPKPKSYNYRLLRVAHDAEFFLLQLFRFEAEPDK